MGVSSDDAVLKLGERQSELLLYDFFKHMTTLSLATLGGVISIPQISELHYPTRTLLLSMGLVIGAGTVAFAGMDGVIKAQLKNEPLSRTTRAARMLSSSLFGMGIGMFVSPLINLPA
jgi:hypothetical protein